MNIPKGIEGDYLETKDDHLFFDIKGFHHPRDRKICFLRFVPDQNGERIKEGRKYRKIYSLNERYLKLEEDYPQFIFFSKELDLKVQSVKNEDIEKIYAPKEYYNSLSLKKELTKLELHSINFCKLLITDGSIPKDAIGISGSPMIGLDLADSDIDIIVYGTRASLEFQEKLKQILLAPNACRAYNLSEYKPHYEWRVGGSNISFKSFLKSEKRKLHQGKYYGIDFFIRYIKSPNDWKGTYYDYQFKNLGRIKVKANIIDSTNSIFTPCSYEINCIKVLESKIIGNNIKLKNLSEVSSFRGRFCEQAIEGESVLVEGKLEEVRFKNNETHLRILLTDQIHDRMIVIAH
jgi:predicted nucleotidyltransferase